LSYPKRFIDFHDDYEIKKSKKLQGNFTSNILMVEPLSFFLNLETAADNKFMNNADGIDALTVTKQANTEFHRFVKELRMNFVGVMVYQQQAMGLPDSIFNNNWFSTHRNEDFPEGLLCIYPMRVPSREFEKNPHFIENEGAHYADILTVDRDEPHHALEGTGSLLFDVINKKLYVNM
jgi:hypothetical protein